MMKKKARKAAKKRKKTPKGKGQKAKSPNVKADQQSPTTNLTVVVDRTTSNDIIDGGGASDIVAAPSADAGASAGSGVAAGAFVGKLKNKKKKLIGMNKKAFKKERLIDMGLKAMKKQQAEMRLGKKLLKKVKNKVKNGPGAYCEINENSDDDDDGEGDESSKIEAIGSRMRKLTPKEIAKTGVYIPPVHVANEENIVDTYNLQLEGGKTLWVNATRIQCEHILLLFAVIFILTAYFDWQNFENVRTYIKPFRHILDRQETNEKNVSEKLGPSTTTVAATKKDILSPTDNSDVDQSGEQKIWVGLCLVVCPILFLNVSRFFLMLWVLDTEDPDYRDHPKLVYVKIVQFISLMHICATCVFFIIISPELQELTQNFVKNFKSRQKYYGNPHFSYIKLEYDQMQMNYGCCGADEPYSWHDSNLYKPSEDVVELWLKNRIMKRYLTMKLSCHYHDKKVGTIDESHIDDSMIKIYLMAHGSNDWTLKDPVRFRIKSLPFSCCDKEKPGFCKFYDNTNQDFYYETNNIPKEGVYEKSCNSTIQPKLVSLSKSIERTMLWRNIFEVIYFLIASMISSSYESWFELRQRPSVVNIPIMSGVFFVIVHIALYFYVIELNFSELFSFNNLFP